MAEQSLHDAVNQPQSVGAPSPTDVPANKTFDPAARAAAELRSAHTEHKSTHSTASLLPGEKGNDKTAIPGNADNRIEGRLRGSDVSIFARLAQGYLLPRHMALALTFHSLLQKRYKA